MLYDDIYETILSFIWSKERIVEMNIKGLGLQLFLGKSALLSIKKKCKDAYLKTFLVLGIAVQVLISWKIKFVKKETYGLMYTF